MFQFCNGEILLHGGGLNECMHMRDIYAVEGSKVSPVFHSISPVHCLYTPCAELHARNAKAVMVMVATQGCDGIGILLNKAYCGHYPRREG